MDGAREHFLAGAGLAGEQDADVGGGDALGDREQLGHLLGDPEAAVGLEGVGRPERGALLLFAPVAVDGDGGVDELADGDAGAAVVEGGPELGDDLPGFVAMGAAGDVQPVAGLRGRLDGLRLGPARGWRRSGCRWSPRATRASASAAPLSSSRAYASRASTWG